MYKAIFKKSSTIDRIYRSIERQSLVPQRLQQLSYGHNTNGIHSHIPSENNSSGTHTHKQNRGKGTTFFISKLKLKLKNTNIDMK